MKAQQLLLTKYANFDDPIVFDDSKDSNFKLITKEYNPDDLKQGEIFIKVIYLSNDPAQKGWFTPYKSYKAVTPLNEIAPAQGLARVIRSKCDKFKEGTYISTFPGWCQYRALDPTKENCNVIPEGLPLVKYLSALGGTTLTAYFTVLKHAPQGEGKVWLVTGAAGGVGSSCIQLISKLHKPKLIIAVAGGKEKCKWVESLASNVKCLDYKDESYKQKFRELGEQVDTFLDQVGGWILNHAILYMRDFGHIVQVGAIAGYNSNSDGFTNYANVIIKRLTIRGMVVVDDAKDFAKARRDLTRWFQDGTLDINNFPEHIVQARGEDFKYVPELWARIFNGENRGKYITQVGPVKENNL